MPTVIFSFTFERAGEQERIQRDAHERDGAGLHRADFSTRRFLPVTRLGLQLAHVRQSRTD